MSEEGIGLTSKWRSIIISFTYSFASHSKFDVPRVITAILEWGCRKHYHVKLLVWYENKIM
jgi:hypothetical protein